MTDDLTLATTHTDGHLAALCVGGEIDTQTAPALRKGALDVIAQGHPHLILDLTGITFCDSSGFNALIGIMRCAIAANGSMTLAAVPDRLSRMLDLTGLSTIMPSYPSIEAAIDARLPTTPEA
ncbi:STAS domain-containing protein [Streptomyces leeuwenhoekii]|uniref:Anti-sigma factor antagonist n=1 Tax=Streptomyces leeuwenhoekii TaxID=1437453 RepID=A0A0F7VLD6_STRLW|nr:STAS domain-containing protein [Streptomyces leeuwenhoekii]KMS76636.1 anti-sigma factor antagonist [Streptomyces leeuwenhoekii]CQR60314.1 Anti-sigma-B factor antagonist [Streptomyces leeuwenhoekii]